MRKNECSSITKDFIAAGIIAVVIFGMVLRPAVSAGQVRGDGDFEFYLDKTVFKGNGDRGEAALFIYIRDREIRFKKSDGIWKARVRMLLEITGTGGSIAAGESKIFEFIEADEIRTSDPLTFQTIIARYELKPGRYSLSCRLEDLNAPKLTVIGMVKNATKESSIESAAFEVPGYEKETLDLSEPEFLWEIQTVNGKESLNPNPSRMYGLYNDSLRVFYELYVPQGLTGKLDYLALILDDKSEPVKEISIVFDPQIDAKSSRGGFRVIPFIVSEDLTTFTAGRYTLYSQFGESGGRTFRVRGGSFDVAWEMRTWEESKKNLLAEARFLMDDEDFKFFKKQDRAEQEVMLKSLWRKMDPDPDTGVNEAYESYLKRFDYANTYFSDYQMGIFTDRGLIFMRFGPPDEIIKDVIPMNRETTSDAVAKVKDKFHPVMFNVHGGRPIPGRVGSEVVLDRRKIGRVGEGGNVAFPYELWIYNKKGNPILKKDLALTPDIGLRFIFVDRDGYGRYKLEVSSTLLEGK